MEALPKDRALEIISFVSGSPEGQSGLEILISAHNR
jgi:hypothetical protein